MNAAALNTVKKGSWKRPADDARYLVRAPAHPASGPAALTVARLEPGQQVCLACPGGGLVSTLCPRTSGAHQKIMHAMF